MRKIETDISKRIAMLRFIMIFGIVILHTPPYIPLAETGNTTFDFLKAFFQHAVFRTSVPVLTCLSGYLLFKSQLHSQFIKLWQKKTKTILVPLLVFNVPIALAVFYIQYTHTIEHQFSIQLYPFEPSVWLNALLGLTTAPINYPINFLRDLYIVSLLAPLYTLLLTKIPKTGFILVSVFFWFNFDSYFILRNLMPIMFYLGGFLAMYNINIRRLDQYAPYLILLFITLCIAVVHFKIQNRDYLRLVAPFLIWPATILMVNTWLGKQCIALAKYSFPIFLMQGPVLLACWLVYNQYLFKIPYWIFWINTPIIVAIILVNIYKISCYALPKTMKIAFGGR